MLHGGGNSSVKAHYEDITGTTVPALYVKGSGWDMATIEAPGLTALHLDRVRDLAALDAMSDPDMMRELDAARFDPAAPSPSVESLLHAVGEPPVLAFVPRLRGRGHSGERSGAQRAGQEAASYRSHVRMMAFVNPRP